MTRLLLFLAAMMAANIAVTAQIPTDLRRMGVNGKVKTISYKYTKFEMRYGKPVAQKPYVQKREWFDKVGRVEKEHWLDEKSKITMLYAYRYDSEARVVENEHELSGMVAAKSRTKFNYDSLGRLASEDKYSVPAGRLETKIIYDYDSVGRLASSIERLFYTSGGSTVHSRTTYVHTDTTYSGIEHQFAADGWVAESRAKTWTTAGVLVSERDTTFSHEGHVLSRFETLYNDRGWTIQRDHQSDYGAGPTSWVVTYRYTTDKNGNWITQEYFMLDRTTEGAVPELRGRVQREFK
jgi:hypothetical protein